jgi:hypothetical protein
VDRLHENYETMSPVHALNNLALVIWALCSANGDFGAAIGDAVAAGWDTDCNGATVGGLFGLSGALIPEAWSPASQSCNSMTSSHERSRWPGKSENSMKFISVTSCGLFAGVLFAVPSNIAVADAAHYDQRSEYRAPKAADAPVVDGVADDVAWDNARWQYLSRRWLGPEYTADDFEGRSKVVWTESKIYILGEFVDDVLIDTHRDPLVQYWDDDCWEIFLDEDFSGGDHQFNHNAFAYHMSLDNQAIDIGTDGKPHNYSHHVESRWKQQGNKVVWELAIDIYTDAYVDGSDDNAPISLSAGKVMGLMLAYCDNDGGELRENFIGSEVVLSGPKDRGWIDAGLFGSLVLVE